MEKEQILVKANIENKQQVTNLIEKVEIREFKKEYAKEMSEIILSNMYSINIKEQGKEVTDRLAKEFTEEEIKNNFSKRAKCYVAIKNNEVVGTASIDNLRGDTTMTKYIILTVFVKQENQGQGIGKMLINEIEKYAKSIDAKQLLILSSIYGCEFYRKLGYDYINGKKELNGDREYTLIKYL